VPDLTLSSQLAWARSLVEADDLLQATAVCRRILKALPWCVDAYPLLAEALLWRGHVADAEGLYARALAADPQSAAAALGLCQIALGRQAPGLARAWWRRATETSMYEGYTRGRLWRVLRDQIGESDLSRAGLGYLMLRSGMYARAAQELQVALSMAPDRDDLRVALAEALYGHGDHSGALAVCDDLLRRLPNCLKALLILGKMTLNTGDEARAREMLQRAQALDPENRRAQRLFGNDSPLPPRLVRIPLDEEVEPFSLPYLSELPDPDEDEAGPPPRLASII